MQTTTIQNLNRLNQRFYKKIAEDFHESRQFYWHGWRLLLPHLQKLQSKSQGMRVLDIGCGNGRFAHFLKDTLESTEFEYVGVDFNQQLLDHAQESLQRKNIAHSLQKIDIVESLLSGNSLQSLIAASQPFDLIVIFGVLHHIPSYQLRKQLLLESAQLLSDHGLLCCTLWRFLDRAKAEEKTVLPQVMDVVSDELEPHDYLVTWNRGKRAIRYCHFTPEYEEERLVHAVEMPCIDQFESDGKEGRGNKYLIFQKLL